MLDFEATQAEIQKLYVELTIINNMLEEYADHNPSLEGNQYAQDQVTRLLTRRINKIEAHIQSLLGDARYALLP
jgi:hypothetical protein